MTTELIDDERMEAEQWRLSQRESLKRKIAKADVARAKIEELNAIVAGVDSDDERATEEHQAACQPIQEALSELDDKHVSQIMVGKSLSDADAKRRRELLRELHEENTKLEDSIEANKRSRGKIQSQIGKLQEQTFHRSVHQGKLVDLASDKLKLQAFAAEQASKWAYARSRAAEESVKKHQGFLDQCVSANDFGNPRVYRDRIARWEFERTEAGRALAEARQRSDQLRAEMIAE